MVYSLLVLSQSLLEHAQLHCIGDISSQQQQQQLLEPQYLSGQLSPLQHSVTLLEVLLRLLPTPAAAAGWGEDRAGEDIAAVVGNLQNKFDLAATAKTGPAVGAKAAVNVDHSASCGSVQPRWTQSIKTPAITAAHRAAAWMPTVRRSTSTPFSACSTASEAKFKSKSGEGLTQGTLPSLAAVKLCFHHCALFMSQLLVFCGELSHKDASSSSSDFLLRSVCAAGHVYQREASVVIKPCRSADSGSGSTAGGSHGDEATRCELSTLCGIVGILQSRTSFVVRCEAYKTLSGFLTGSPK